MRSIHSVCTLAGITFAAMLAGCTHQSKPAEQQRWNSASAGLNDTGPAWTARIGSAGSDQLNGSALDSTGAVVVAGQAPAAVDGQSWAGGLDLVVAKYSTSGTKLWTRELGGSLDDSAGGVAVGSGDNIFVGGYIRGDADGQTSFGSQDFALIKYAPNGTKLWTRLFGTVDGDYGTSVATSGSAVYLGGYTRSYILGSVRGGKLEAMLVKYDDAGNRLWATSFGSTEDDKVLGVAADASGNVYAVGVAGASLPGNSSHGGKDLFVAKFNASGTRQWITQLGTTADDSATGITVGVDGAVYVSATTGSALGGAFQGGASDAALLKINTDGTLAWGLQYGTAKDDEGTAIASDSSAIYLTGKTKGQLPGANSAGDLDLFVASFDASGTRLATRQFSGAWAATASGSSLGVAAANGRVALAGFVPAVLFDGIPAIGGVDGVVMDLCAGNGFSCLLDGDCLIANGGCTASQTCNRAGLGTVYCGCGTGYTGVTTCTDLNECRANNGGCSANATCANTVGSYTCTCGSGFYGDGQTCDIDGCLSNGGCDARATCTNLGGGARSCNCPTGFELASDGVTCVDVDECSLAVCRPDQVCANAIGSYLCTCAAGYHENSGACIPAGQAWTARLGTTQADQINAVALTSTGDVVVSGQTRGLLDGEPYVGGWDGFVTKYSKTGSRQWTREFGFLMDDAATGAAVGGGDNIYVAGYFRGNSIDGQTSTGNQDYVLIKYASDGTKLWTRLFGTVAGDFGTSVATSGNAVYVGGYTASYIVGNARGGKLEGMLVKYDDAGTKLWATSFGSTEDDKVLGVAVGPGGDLFVTGVAGAAMPGQTSLGGTDAFVAKYSASGTRVWMRQLGTSSNDSGNGITVSPDGTLHVVANMGGDVAELRLNTDGTVLGSTAIASSALDEGWGIASDSTGVYVTGRTLGHLPGANSAGDSDIFLAKLSAGGTLQTVRQFSGTWNAATATSGTGVAVGGGRVVVGGYLPFGTFEGSVSLGGYLDGVVLSLCNTDGFVCVKPGDCSSSNGGCTASQTCTAAGGGNVLCGCGAGYTGVTVCTDLNECRANNGGCDTNASCANTSGSYTCTCTGGFYGDGHTCDIDGCIANGGCDARATCVNLGGGARTCNCPSGFQLAGDDVTCEDVDECGLGSCRPDQSCTNTSGSFSCACPPGYEDVSNTCVPAGPAWTARLGTNQADQINAVGLSSGGDVVVAGQVRAALDGQTYAGGLDGIVTNYSKTGTKQWTREFGASQDDAAAGVAVGSGDSVFVAGYVRGNLDGQTSAGSQDYALIKYASDGTKVWTRLFGTVAGDFGTSVATRGGAVYVGGYTASYIVGNARGGKLEAMLVKYDEAGTKLWATSFGSSEDDKVLGVAVGPDGDLFVTGVAGAALPGQFSLGGTDAFVAKYTASGTRVWIQQFGTGDNDSGNALAVGADGLIYVAITTGADAALVALNPDGSELSRQLLSSPDVDQASGVAVDGSGIYVTGRTLGVLPGAAGNGADLFVAKFQLASSGSPLVTRQFSGAWTAPNSAVGLGVAAGNGRVVVGGSIPVGVFDGLASLGGTDGAVLSLCDTDTLTCPVAGDCATNNGGCRAGLTCTQLDASVVSCECGPGYTGVMACVDVNECILNYGGCDHGVCQNSAGSRTCDCDDNWLGDSCDTSADPCVTSNPCNAATEICSTTDGAVSCTDICEVSHGGCAAAENCAHDESGTITCTDVCQVNNGGCATGLLCTHNAPGSVTCTDLCPDDPNKTAPDLCGCGVSDVDQNGNGAPDCFEYFADLCPSDSAKTNPGVCGCGLSDADANGNGIPDCLDSGKDLCPDDATKTLPGPCGCGTSDSTPGLGGGSIPTCLYFTPDLCPGDPAKTTAGVCGCGISDVDSNHNGVPNCLESGRDLCPDDAAKTQPGFCGCGVKDTLDSKHNLIPYCVEANIDVCPTDDAKTFPGVCGCGVSDVDADHNGVPDCLDSGTDLCPDDPAKTVPGTCGCGLSDVATPTPDLPQPLVRVVPDCALTGRACADSGVCGTTGAAGRCQDGGRFPGGYCSSACTADAQCLTGAHCGYKNASGAGVCLNRCASTNDCRSGYVCVDADGDSVTECSAAYCEAPPVNPEITFVTPQKMVRQSQNNTREFYSQIPLWDPYQTSLFDMSLDAYLTCVHVQIPQDCGDGDYNYDWRVDVIGGDWDYSNRGITGYLTPTLCFGRNTLPDGFDVVLHLVVHRLSDDSYPEFLFNSHVVNSSLDLDMATTCQSQTTACSTCACRFPLALPTTEPH